MVRRFTFIRDEITKRKKKIDRYQKNIKKFRTERRDFERERNNKIFKYQKNRNPYIDLPHLVEMIDNF